MHVGKYADVDVKCKPRSFDIILVILVMTSKVALLPQTDFQQAFYLREVYNLQTIH